MRVDPYASNSRPMTECSLVFEQGVLFGSSHKERGVLHTLHNVPVRKSMFDKNVDILF